jgi:hypothetical protein
VSRVALLVLVALLVPTGCSDDGSEAPSADVTSPLTASELGWIRAYSTWTIELNDSSAAGPDVVRRCRDRVDEFGSPPTERLEAAASLASSACAFLAEKGMRRRAIDVIEEADEQILPYLREEQPVQLGSGESNGSRADIALSEAASEWVDRPVEVRCWSKPDWRRVVDEDNAWNNESTDYLDLVGWSDNSTDRIHIVLEQCNLLSRLRAGDDIANWAGDERIDAADSLATLAHEVAHLLAPDADEAATECRAARSLVRYGQRLGVDRASALELSELYRSEIYPDLDEEYREGGCPE